MVLVMGLVGLGRVEDRSADGTSPMMLACFGGHIDVVELLVQSRADLFARNSFDCDAGHFAGLGGSIEACRWLSEHGMSLLRPQCSGHTVLHKAAERGHLPLASFLISSFGEEDLKALRTCSIMQLSRRALVLFAVAGFLVDLIIAGTDFHLGHISHKDSHASTYESATSDTLTCCLVRLVVFPVISLLALLVYRSTEARSPLRKLQREQEAEVSSSPPRNGNELRVPLAEEPIPMQVVNGVNGHSSSVASSASSVATWHHAGPGAVSALGQSL
eukprot:g15635.t1